MPGKDKYLSVAKALKREMDNASFQFKSMNIAELEERATEIGGPGMHVTKDEGAKLMTGCLQDVGLTIFPLLENAPEDGYVRIMRSGSLLATILVNLQTPGPGSDEDLAVLINRIKRRDLPPAVEQ